MSEGETPRIYEQPEYIAQAIERAAGKCEICNQPFEKDDDVKTFASGWDSNENHPGVVICHDECGHKAEEESRS